MPNQRRRVASRSPSCKVSSFGFRVSGSELGVCGLEFRDSGSELGEGGRKGPLGGWAAGFSKLSMAMRPSSWKAPANSGRILKMKSRASVLRIRNPLTPALSPKRDDGVRPLPCRCSSHPSGRGYHCCDSCPFVILSGRVLLSCANSLAAKERKECKGCCLCLCDLCNRLWLRRQPR